ncbi:hypothetical protein OHB06_01600 [Streptomyces sp. NBC_01604]
MLLFELDGTEVAEVLLDAAGVIETVDGLEEREIRLGSGVEGPSPDALCFNQHPQVLRQGIVERVADRAHGRLNTCSDQACCELDGRVLRTVVALVDEFAGGDLAAGQRVLEAGED